MGRFAVADCPVAGLTLRSTARVGFISTGHHSAAGKPVASDLIACAEGDCDRFSSGAAFYALCVADGGPSRYGVIIRGTFQHAGAGMTTQHGFIVSPFCWENEFPAYEDVYTAWLQVVPITDQRPRSRKLVAEMPSRTCSNSVNPTSSISTAPA